MIDTTASHLTSHSMIDENVKEEVKEQPKGISTLQSDRFINMNCIANLPRHSFNLVTLPVRMPINAMIPASTRTACRHGRYAPI